MWASRPCSTSWCGEKVANHLPGWAPDPPPQPAAARFSHGTPRPAGAARKPWHRTNPSPLIGRALVKSARGAIGEVDLVAVACDGSERGPGRATPSSSNLQHGRAPVLVGAQQQGKNFPSLIPPPPFPAEQLNADLVDGALDSRRPRIDCSASTGRAAGAGFDALAARLPSPPTFYIQRTVSDQPEAAFCSAELIREQGAHPHAGGAPHSVLVQGWSGSLKMGSSAPPCCHVLVERSQPEKASLIGKGGSMLKEIGNGAPAIRWRRSSTARFIWSCLSRCAQPGGAVPLAAGELGYSGD